MHSGREHRKEEEEMFLFVALEILPQKRVIYVLPPRDEVSLCSFPRAADVSDDKEFLWEDDGEAFPSFS